LTQNKRNETIQNIPHTQFLLPDPEDHCANYDAFCKELENQSRQEGEPMQPPNASATIIVTPGASLVSALTTAVQPPQQQPQFSNVWQDQNQPMEQRPMSFPQNPPQPAYSPKKSPKSKPYPPKQKMSGPSSFKSRRRNRENGFRTRGRMPFHERKRQYEGRSGRNNNQKFVITRSPDRARGKRPLRPKGRRSRSRSWERPSRKGNNW